MTLFERLHAIEQSPVGLNISQLATESGVNYSLLYRFFQGNLARELTEEEEQRIIAALDRAKECLSSQEPGALGV